MRFIVIICMMLATSTAFAKGSHYTPNGDTAGIVTPDIAIGAFRVDGSDVTVSSDGQMVYCHPAYNRDKNSCVYKGQNMWRTFQQLVPQGRVYVGFKLTNRYYGYTAYDIFWK